MRSPGLEKIESHHWDPEKSLKKALGNLGALEALGGVPVDSGKKPKEASMKSDLVDL